jgi:hypothetical protein
MATTKTTPVIATSMSPTPEVTTVANLATRLASWLRRLPPPQERIGRLVAELDERFAGRTEWITEDACAEIERVAWRYSRHLLLNYGPDGTGKPDEEDRAGPNQIRRPSCPRPPTYGRFRGWTVACTPSRTRTVDHPWITRPGPSDTRGFDRSGRPIVLNSARGIGGIQLSRIGEQG